MAQECSIKSYDNLIGMLDERAKAFEEKEAFILLDHEGEQVDKITYKNLVFQSKIIAANLQQKTKKGRTCLLVFNPGIEFITALVACFYSGVIAVPVYPPKINKTNERFEAIIRDAEPDCIMLSSDINDKFFKKEKGRKYSKIPRMIVDRSNRAKHHDYVQPEIQEDDIAVLQYTSGTTGDPNGTMITHRGILYNSEVIKRSFNHDENLVGVNWLPPYHDMGLFGTLIQPMYVGGTNVIIDPYDFIRNPVIWLNAITRYKGTTAGCPNFALNLLVERVSAEQKHYIDLSSLKVLFCGSETIRKLYLQRFLKYFAICGFKENMFLPCYGLAENTLFASGISHDETPQCLRLVKSKLEIEQKVELTKDIDGVSYVSIGYPRIEDEIVIVNPKNRIPLAEGYLGEIWITGKSVSPGYWKKPKKTELIFHAQLNGNSEKLFLRTGDLGFKHKGHLYFAGRLKNMIIIRGQNFFPEDIANSVGNSHPALQADACAVFSETIKHEEQLIIVQEIKRTAINNLDFNEVIKSIRKTIALEYEISVYAIILVYPGRVLKTSSGKIQHHKCKHLWKTGGFNAIHSWTIKDSESKVNLIPISNTAPTIENIQAWLIKWISKRMGISTGEIDPETHVLSYGLDSMGAVELEREAREIFGIEIHPLDFMENNKISTLAKIGYESIKKKQMA